MRQRTIAKSAGHWARTIAEVRRRHGWLLRNLSFPKVGNLFSSAAHFALRREVVRALPALLKVDISPLCNLRCPSCVHAAESVVGPEEPQRFHRRQVMSLARYESLVGQVAGRSLAVSLYYLGDPLMHPDLASICRATADAGLASHISTNFSFRWSDDELEALLRSGLTHLTVCLDGMTAPSYARTRVGGDIGLVRYNLARLMGMRQRLRPKRPEVEVQYIKFQHNVHELPEAMAWCAALGIDQFTHYWGALHNYADLSPHRLSHATPRAPRFHPECMWPYFGMVIKYDGDAIPCCVHRQAAQHSPGADARSLGNVFATSVSEVWNSEPYRRLRRLVANPRAAHDESAFCHGCDAVYQTDRASLARRADVHRWEDTMAPRLPTGRSLPVIGARSDRQVDDIRTL